MAIADILGVSGVGVLVVLGLIRIKPLEISVLHWLLKQIGKCFNGEILDKVDEIDKKVDKHLAEHEREQAVSNRQRILRFSDEVYDGKKKSKESFEDITIIIKDYQDYCAAHTDFPNGKTETAISIIDETYRDLYKSHGFKEEDK